MMKTAVRSCWANFATSRDNLSLFHQLWPCGQIQNHIQSCMSIKWGEFGARESVSSFSGWKSAIRRHISSVQSKMDYVCQFHTGQELKGLYLYPKAKLAASRERGWLSVTAKRDSFLNRKLGIREPKIILWYQINHLNDFIMKLGPETFFWAC